MPTKLFTLTDISRKMGRDYRGIRDRDKRVKTPAAVVVIGGKKIKLFRLDQFGLQDIAR
jgi:hypothetical protein